MGAAKRIKKVVLELGGSDPFIVMPSAHLDEAVATLPLKARILNNGQSCINAKRFNIIAESIAEEFQERFVKTMEALKVGDPFDEKTDLGPLATADGVKDIEQQEFPEQSGRSRGARSDGRQETRPTRVSLLRAHRLIGNSEELARVFRGILWPGGKFVPREESQRSHSDRQRHPLRPRCQRLDE